MNSQGQERSANTVADIYRLISGGLDGDKYELASKTPATWRRYGSAYRAYDEWAREDERQPFPVTVANAKAFFTDMMESGGAVGSMDIARQTLSLAQRLRGHDPINWPLIREFMQGVRRVHGGARRQAPPVWGADLEAMLGLLDPTTVRGARDGAILAVTWGGALRSDEVTTLAWDAEGPHGKGYVTTSARGLELTLTKAKTAQDREVQRVVVPAEDAAIVALWLDHWARIAGRSPGKLVFYQLSRCDRILPRGMAAPAVTSILRARVLQFLLAKGVPEVEARTLANRYTSHGLRAGYATTAAARGMIEDKIRRHCRHKSAQTTAGYIRQAESWSDGGLKGLL